MAEPVRGLVESLRDRYAIERELGRGGMATVYLARDLRHDRPVALKVLHADLSASLGPERFLREIRLAARLQHPHILTVLDSGEVAVPGAPPLLWFTMPFVRGESLRDRLTREKQLPVEDALRITREAADALAYAHEEGIIHRDIKPENILLAGTHALVADFGIARALGAGDEKLTETGLAVGTPAYMSPEQASGQRDLDQRTDIYSLGVVLYEMLAGETPFAAPTAQAMIARRFMETPRPVRLLRETVPEQVEQALQRALARTAADRFATAAELARALEPGTRPLASVTTGAPPIPPPATSATAPARSPRRVNAAVTFVLGLLVTATMGMLVWQRAHRSVEDTGKGPKFVAVLPFENLGSPDEEYFADGVTDAVRGKLTGLPGLEVIASNSSSQYKHASKTPQQIGQELGVQYLVVGKVRWEKRDGTNRVQVSPELIQVSTGTARWQQPFNAAITDVFQVQADIAGNVAEALNVALGAGERQALAQKPTQSIAAYDAFLKGEEASARLGESDPGKLRQAIGYYERAVALDSGFVGAWAELSRAHSALYYNGSGNGGDAGAALAGAQRAAAVGPDAGETHLALGDYYNLVVGDFARALEQYAGGLQRTPANSDLLAGSAIVEQSLGRMDSALALFQRAATLDPRSVFPIRRMARALLWLRRYPEAQEATERGLAIAPDNLSLLQNRAMVALAQGDLAGARASLQNAKGVDPIGLVAFMANYWDTYWALSESQQDLLLRLTPAPFDDNRGAWGLTLAGTYRLRGQEARMRAYADTARRAFEEALKLTPDDAQSHPLLGVALAYLGRKAEAIREGERGVAQAPISKDAYGGPYNQLQLVRIYILVDEPEKALDLLEPLLRIPFYLSPGWLKIDPTFDPLRKNPRFMKLVAGTA
ncbi:MAG TPA: protein kinase [Gemmatimonadales bacterium]|jgi:eukaryotic-like serine/threonine-protein kinase|nr:protein kinase [Gemmatimonadales bacterium]